MMLSNYARLEEHNLSIKEFELFTAYSPLNVMNVEEANADGVVTQPLAPAGVDNGVVQPPLPPPAGVDNGVVPPPLLPPAGVDNGVVPPPPLPPAGVDNGVVPPLLPPPAGVNNGVVPPPPPAGVNNGVVPPPPPAGVNNGLPPPPGGNALVWPMIPPNFQPFFRLTQNRRGWGNRRGRGMSRRCRHSPATKIIIFKL